VNDRRTRQWLLRRISLAGRDFANAEPTRHGYHRGQALALLDVGVHLGYWSARSAGYAADMIEHRQSMRRLSRILRAF
jgi:hypothetical protein